MMALLGVDEPEFDSFGTSIRLHTPLCNSDGDSDLDTVVKIAGSTSAINQTATDSYQTRDLKYTKYQEPRPMRSDQESDDKNRSPRGSVKSCWFVISPISCVFCHPLSHRVFHCQFQQSISTDSDATLSTSSSTSDDDSVKDQDYDPEKTLQHSFSDIEEHITPSHERRRSTSYIYNVSSSEASSSWLQSASGKRKAERDDIQARDSSTFGSVGFGSSSSSSSMSWSMKPSSKRSAPPTQGQARRRGKVFPQGEDGCAFVIVWAQVGYGKKIWPHEARCTIWENLKK
ncbi:hypothetical protein GWK47_020798 [Chionoecetes opilio]|uniref:Uncharacterized protein n=1 Tax=Chionoecetes opilio TaxID=41210 RepID=A0A8J5CH76_CHIOP|nr:hypothetical protein GWK47_020798 [Chionoecetes opilio]